MRCTVIGASGFLGSAFADELESHGDEVIRADYTIRPGDTTSRFCDVRDIQSVEQVVEGADEVYLIAGVLGTAELDESIAKAVEINTLGCVHVLDACVKAKVKRFFYPSKPDYWLCTYTITKMASEQFVRLYEERYGLKSVIVRPFNAYGPGQHAYPVQKILPTFCLQASLGLPIAVWGSGRNKCDLIYHKDIARISVDAMRAGLTGRVYDLGRGIPMPAVDIARYVNILAGHDPENIVHLPMRTGETEGSTLVAKMEPLRRDFEDVGVPLHVSDFGETMRETYEYYRNLSVDEIEKAVDMWRKNGYPH
jgi:UDP-glucose 4-epimerase